MLRHTSDGLASNRQPSALSVVRLAVGLVWTLLFSLTGWAQGFTCQLKTCSGGVGGKLIEYNCPSKQDQGTWDCCADDPCIKGPQARCEPDGWECSWLDKCTGETEVEGYYCPS